MITIMQRRLLTFWLKLLMVGGLLLWHAGAQASEIGSGDTSVTIGAQSQMADNLTFDVTQGVPVVNPNPPTATQMAAVNAQVSLSWPTTANVSIQEQHYEIVDADDGTINSVLVPDGYAVSIDNDRHSATLTRYGGNNGESFALTVNIAYDTPGSKSMFVGGRITCGDGSVTVSDETTLIAVAGAASTASTYSMMNAPVIGPDPVAPLDPATQEALNSLFKGGRALSVLKGTVIVEVGTVTVVSGVVIAAGAYAIVDGVVYFRTGKSVGPFTTLGRWVADTYLPGQVELPANAVVTILPIDPMTATAIAVERAIRKKTDVCLELAGMEWFSQRKRLTNIVNVIKAAERSEDCANDNQSIVLYHYTDSDGYIRINSSGKASITFVASQPRHPDKPFGVYFTTKPPNTKNLAATIKTSREKIRYYFKVLLPRNKVVPIPGGKGIFIWYSPVTITVPRVNVLEDTKNPFVK